MTICTLSRHLWLRTAALFAISMGVAASVAMAQQVRLPAHGPAATGGGAASDLGPLPASQMLTLTVRLNPGSDRAAALDQTIAAQQTPGSGQYRQWLTPEEFAAHFGATDERIAAVAAWLESQGLAVTGTSAGKTRLTVTGSILSVQSAFGLEMRRYASGGSLYFANAGAASVPAEMAGLVADVSGLDDRSTTSMIVAARGSNGAALPVASGVNPLAAIESAVDADQASTIAVTSSACSADFGDADYLDYRAALKQAEAQGITVLATSGCKSAMGKQGSFPASLAEVAAIAALNDSGSESAVIENPAAEFLGIAARPSWQFAEGLPSDGYRDEPDVTSELSALAQTLLGISQRAGTRLGNVAPVLYELAKTPGLYTQPDDAEDAAGVWKPRTGLGVVNLKVLAQVFPRGLIGTSSLLVPSSFAPYHGKLLTLTTTVTSTGGSGIPTGMVTFTSTQKGTLGTAMLDATGNATFSSDQLQGGTYTVTSVYAGDANYTGSTSGIATITVVGELSLITATVGSGAAVGGNAAIAVSVTSASGIGTPSGTVTVAPQGTTNTATASAAIAGTNGTATGTVQLPVFQAGQFTVLVSCTDPDPSFTCNSPVSIQMTVAKGVSTTAITSSPSSPSAGQPYTLTATVSAGAATAAARTGSGSSLAGATLQASPARPQSTRATGVHSMTTSADETPTGSVQFLDGTTVLGTESLASGTATYSGTASSATHNFNAVYSGDQNYATSNSSTPTTTTSGLPTSTSLTASAYAITVGQTITFYSTVYSVGVPSTMTGTVTYSAAAQGVLGSGTVSGGLATLTLNNLAAGTYNLTATYSGDSVFAGSSSATAVVVTVSAVAATITGSILPSPLPYGYNANLTGTVSFASGLTIPPAGTLQAVVSGVAGDSFVQPLVPVAAVGPSSTATFTFPAPPPGTYSVVLSCPATDTFPCSLPVTVPMTVVQGNTSTSLALNPPSPLAGQKTTLTATISNLGNNPAAQAFTGSVQFLVNNKLVGTAAVSGGTASVQVALAAGAAQSIVAVYSGDTNWTSSTSAAVTVSVAALLTATSLTSNVSQVIAGVQVVLTATVTGTAAEVISATAPSGLVDFYDTYNGVLSKLGSATLASLGANASVATFNATALPAGTHAIYSIYEGDLVYSGSNSGTLTLGFTNFSVTFVPTTMTITQGQTGSATLVVDFQGGFSGTVAFGCTPPANVELTCSFSPSVLQAGGTTTLTVATVAPSDRSGQQSGLMGRLAGGVALAMLLLWIKPERRRARLGLLLLLVALGVSGATGCAGTNLSTGGSGQSTPVTPSNPGSSLGTQILAITAAGSDGTNTVRHDFQYQVTVQ